MAVVYTKAQQRELFVRLKALLAEGMELDEACASLGMSWEDFEVFMVAFYNHETSEIKGKTTEEVYVDYCIEQSKNIYDLTKIVERFKVAANSGAMVSAIKARSDIYDKIVSRGQEFGFIEKKPEAKLVAGVLVNQLTDGDLRARITQQLASLGGLMNQFGDNVSIIDIDPGPTHKPTPKKKALSSGTGKGIVRGHAKTQKSESPRVTDGKAE